MRKYIRQPTAIVTKYDQTTGVRESRNVVGLREFPTLTQVALKHRGFIRSHRRLKLMQLPFENDIVLHPAVKRAKRQLRNLLKNHERKRDLGHFNGVVFTQVIYCNHIVQAFFEFALKYAFIIAVEGKRRFYLSKAKKAFELAFRESVIQPTTQKDAEGREAAKAVLDHTYALEHKLPKETLDKLLQQGRPPGATNSTLEMLSHKKDGLTDFQIAKKMNPNYSHRQLKKEEAKISRTLARYDAEPKPRNRTKK